MGKMKKSMQSLGQFVASCRDRGWSGLNIPWPWQRAISGDLLVCSWESKVLAFVQARQEGGVWVISRMGVERQGSASLAEFSHRLKGLGLKGLPAIAMLRLRQYQFLQIDTPNVPLEERRAAARYRIREMLKSRLDEVVVDMLGVGDGQHQQLGHHSFVVAALQSEVHAAIRLAQSLGWRMSVIDIQETAQRNFQSSLARLNAQPGLANAALIVVPGQQALLTICANGELFYTRRFDVHDDFLTGDWGQEAMLSAADEGPALVEEYVPAYEVGDLSLGEIFSDIDAPRIHDSSAMPSEKSVAYRLLVEVKRSLDMWNRTWSSLPLGELRVYAGHRSGELAEWLTQQLAQNVLPLETKTLFPGFDLAPSEQQAACLPLLGIFLRLDNTLS